jgi:hypothetical protein
MTLMSKLANTLIKVQNLFESHLNETCEQVIDPVSLPFSYPGWTNTTWVSPLYKKAGINVIDARDTKGLWMMHCCIFPHNHNNSPIFGFDIFAGKNKITGCFHDFSPVDRLHPMLNWFEQYSATLDWNKKRDLPAWAKPIFSDAIIAAGNIQEDSEIDQIYTVIEHTLKYYLSSLDSFNYTQDESNESHLFYCQQQKQNPHNPRVLMSLGLTEYQALSYITDCLFKEH